jgi:hypothetical protein
VVFIATYKQLYVQISKLHRISEGRISVTLLLLSCDNMAANPLLLRAYQSISCAMCSHPCDRVSMNFDLRRPFWRYTPLCALASLIISLPTFLSRAFFRHAFTPKLVRSLNTEYSYLNLGLPFFLLLLAVRSLL